MKVLREGAEGVKYTYTCRNCKSLIQFHEMEADWLNDEFDPVHYGVTCPVCNDYWEYDGDGKEVWL